MKGVKKRRSKTAPVKAARPSVIDKLPTMKIDEVMRLFQNAVRIVADPGKRSQRRAARQVLAAIDKEWVRRRQLPPRPDEYFAWPTTDAPGGDGSLDVHGWPSEGLLTFMDYRVGSTNGVVSPVRKALLSELFTTNLPPAFPPDYLDQWGRPSSATRLQKMAESIAAFTRLAKRRRNREMGAAIRDWEDDLRFLYEKFYVGHFRFAWPPTTF